MSALQDLTSQLTGLWDHEEVVKLRNQFNELEPNTQIAVIAGAVGSLALVVVGSIVWFTLSLHSIRNSISEHAESTAYLVASNDKISDIRQKLAMQQSAESIQAEEAKNLQLREFLQKTADRYAVSKESVELAAEKKGGDKEFNITNMDIRLSKVSIRQITGILFFIENAKGGIRLGPVTIDTKGNTEGYLWATINVSKRERKPTKPGAKSS